MNGKSSERRPRLWTPPGLTTPDGRSLQQQEADQAEVEEMARAVYNMCAERRIVIEAQIIIQGKAMNSNVVFRKLLPGEQIEQIPER